MANPTRWRHRTRLRSRLPSIGPERLEPRLLLAREATIEVAADTLASYQRVEPNWFAEVSHANASQPNMGDTVFVARLTPAATAEISHVSDANRFFSGPISFNVLRGLGLPGQMLIATSADSAIASDVLQSNPNVAYFEHNRSINGQAVPDDPDFSLQYGLDNQGQNDGTNDADIDAPEAWDLATGNRDLVGVGNRLGRRSGSP